jgi:hypothetical protein
MVGANRNNNIFDILGPFNWPAAYCWTLADFMGPTRVHFSCLRLILGHSQFSEISGANGDNDIFEF